MLLMTIVLWNGRELTVEVADIIDLVATGSSCLLGRSMRQCSFVILLLRSSRIQGVLLAQEDGTLILKTTRMPSLDIDTALPMTQYIKILP